MDKYVVSFSDFKSKMFQSMVIERIFSKTAPFDFNLYLFCLCSVKFSAMAKTYS